MAKVKDLTNRVFGRLTAIKCVGRDKWGAAIWLCRCSCSGKEVEVTSHNLLSGHVKSCSCLSREMAAARNGEKSPSFKHGHGSHYSSSTYRSWRAMIQRTQNPNNKRYLHYGGAGVKVDPRWLGEHGFENFLADMGERPPGTTLGRFTDMGDYSPENCEWETPKQQGAQQRMKNQLVWLAA